MIMMRFLLGQLKLSLHQITSMTKRYGYEGLINGDTGISSSVYSQLAVEHSVEFYLLKRDQTCRVHSARR